MAKKRMHQVNQGPKAESEKVQRKKRLKKIKEQLSMNGKVNHELTDHQSFCRTGAHQDKKRKEKSSRSKSRQQCKDYAKKGDND